MALRKQRAFMTLSAVGILAMSWMVAGMQNRRIDENALKNAGKTGQEWLTYGLDMGETRYSPLKQIDATNVSRLGLAWSYAIGPGGGDQEGTLLMANGTLYGITNWSITYALDARTGKELWRYDPKVDQPAIRPRICCGVVNRGIAIYDGKLFVPVIDGRLVALDAAKGTNSGASKPHRGSAVHDDDGATNRKEQSHCRQCRRREAGARVLLRLRHRERQTGVAVLHRSR